MKKLAILLTMLTVVFYANGQNEKDFKNPDEQTIVNKEYDKDGNLIGYDSTYIHRWSNDTSQIFGNRFFFDDRFSEMNQFLKEFFNDSSMQNFNFSPNLDHSPLRFDDFFRNFNPSFSDSTFINEYNFNIDSLQHFHHQFNIPELNEIQRKMHDQFKNYNFPDSVNPFFLNEKQKKELLDLQNKYQKEIEDLQKKWEEK